MKLKKVGVMSAAKILGILYAVIGLIAGAFMTIFALTGVFGAGEPTGGMVFFGAGAIIVMPILYGIMGFVGGIIGAWIYNMVAKSMGGLEIELEKMPEIPKIEQ